MNCGCEHCKVLEYLNKMCRFRTNDYNPQEVNVKDIFNKINQNYLNVKYLKEVDPNYKPTSDPITLVTEDDRMYLADGHHRLKAHTEDTIMARVIPTWDLRLTPHMKEIIWKKNAASTK